MSDRPIIITTQGRAGRITLNRPKALHALNLEMCEAMTTAMLDWAHDPDIDCVLVDHAPNTRGFCAGGDIRILSESGRADGKKGAEFFAVEYRLNTLMKEYPKPYITLMDGVTMGGGVGICVHGSHRIATERTLFAMPEASIGLIPDVGGGYFLPRLDGELGTWLALSGDRLKGEDVLALGVATHFTPSDKIPALTEAICKDGVAALAGLQTTAMSSFEDNKSEIAAAFSADSVAAILARLDKGSAWAQDLAARIKAKSPLTLKAALRQLREGATLDFRDVMRMEYRICTRMIMTPNFQEGVRAVLIDKDNTPKWTPATLADVEDSYIDTLFAPLPKDLDFLEI